MVIGARLVAEHLALLIVRALFLRRVRRGRGLAPAEQGRANGQTQSTSQFPKSWFQLKRPLTLLSTLSRHHNRWLEASQNARYSQGLLSIA